jgi:hypothetical protein
MNAYPLFMEDGSRAGIWVCGHCRIVFNDETSAGRCCEVSVCECGQPCEPYWLICGSCRSKKAVARELAVWSAARKLPACEYSGPVYADHDQEIHADVDAFLCSWEEFCFDNPGAVGTSPRAYACVPYGLQFDAGEFLEACLQDHYDEALEEIDDAAVAKLQAFVDAWDREHGPTSYRQDPTTAIVWPEDETK